jgi:hypothetical protein
MGLKIKKRSMIAVNLRPAVYVFVGMEVRTTGLMKPDVDKKIKKLLLRAMLAVESSDWFVVESQSVNNSAPSIASLPHRLVYESNSIGGHVSFTSTNITIKIINTFLRICLKFREFADPYFQKLTNASTHPWPVDPRWIMNLVESHIILLPDQNHTLTMYSLTL